MEQATCSSPWERCSGGYTASRGCWQALCDMACALQAHLPLALGEKRLRDGASLQ